MTAVGTKVFASEYNAIQAAINTVLGIGAGGSGYGQTVLSSQVSTSSSITVTQWTNLRTDLLKAYLHQGLPGNLPLPGVPQKTTPPYTVVTYSDYNKYLDLSTVITANAAITPPAGQATLQTFSSGTRTTSWNGELVHQVILTFAGPNQARYYFNSGGNIQFSASLINYPGYPGYGSQSASYAKNSDWNMLLNNMGTTTFGRNSTVNSGNGTGQTILSAVGYFQLTTSEQNIYRKTTSSASYTPNQYDLYASVDVTGAIITFNIRFKDLATISGNNPSFAIDENVEGLLTSLVQGYYASGEYVAATPPATTSVFSGGVVVAPPAPPPVPPVVIPPPVVPPVVYNEVVNAPASVQGTGGAGQTAAFSMTISGGVPNTNYSYSVTGGVSGGSGVLNSSGSATLSGLTHPNNITSGTFTYTFSFAGSGNTRTVSVTATAAPAQPSYGPFTASPNPATNGQLITLSATTYNVPATGNPAYAMTVFNNAVSTVLQNTGPYPGSGTQTITSTFTFFESQAPYITAFGGGGSGTFPPAINGPTITLYVPPVVTPPSYGTASWSPVGPVANGTSVTFSAVANNAVGDVWGIGILNNGVNTTITGVITTNPQTVSRTVTAVYSLSQNYVYGTFLISSLSPANITASVYVDAPAAPPPPTPTYSVTGSSSVNEGGTVSVSITSTNVPNGTSLYWQLTSTVTGLTPEADANDFGQTSGSFVINSNAGSFGVGVTADNLTEGTEFRAVRVYSDSGLSNQIGYVAFSISDTSTSPVYNESVSGPSVVNVGYANFSVSLTGGAPNTGYSWTGRTSGSGTLNGAGAADIPFGVGAAAGSYSFTVTFAATGNVRTYSITIAASPSYGTYGWSPAGPVANGTVATFVAEAVNAVGLSYGMTTINNGVQGPTITGTITSNPQTIFTSISVIYNPSINPYGIFYITGVSGTVSATIVVNAPAPPPVVYNEVLSGPSTVVVNVPFSMTISGGAPNTGFTWSGDATGSASLDGSGSGTFSNVVVPTARSYSWTFVFAGSGNSRTYSVTATAPAAPAAITAYGFSNPTFVPGQILFFYGTVSGAIGRNWAMGVYQNGSYLPTATGTINQDPQSITYPFLATTGYHVGTFIVDGLAYVQSSYTVPGQDP